MMPVYDNIRIRRRTSGAGGPPASLLNAEPAYNEVNDVLYIGVGQGIDGKAQTIKAIAGAGAFATNEYVVSAVAGVTSQLANYLTITAAASTYLRISVASTTYLTRASASNTYAPLDSAHLIGIPTAPTAENLTSTTQVANTAFVQTAVGLVKGEVPQSLDTLKKIADAIGSDASFSETVVNALAAKLNQTSNLSDLTSTSDARENLELGTMAVQNADNVSITGGSIQSVIIDGGSF